ncbi:MAG TPA: ABC transporter permease [Candidatus Nanopelagicales bacterium]
MSAQEPRGAAGWPPSDDPGGEGVAAKTPPTTRAVAAVRHYWPTAALLVALVLLWQLAINVFDVPNYVVPAPSEIFATLVADWSDILASALWTTMAEVIIGFAISVVAGVGIATILHWSPLTRRVVYPLLIGSQTVPIVVIAPILAIIFGYTLLPKVLLVALVCFFPIVVNTLDGFASTDPDLLRMMRTLDGSRWGSFRKIEFPASLPSMFSGLRIAATYASVGAVFGEYGGSENGLGYVMIQATPQLQTSLVFAAILLLSLMSIALFLVVSGTERLLAPWAHEGTAS